MVGPSGNRQLREGTLVFLPFSAREPSAGRARDGAPSPIEAALYVASPSRADASARRPAGEATLHRGVGWRPRRLALATLQAATQLAAPERFAFPR
jgi:hypothetical protein